MTSGPGPGQSQFIRIALILIALILEVGIWIEYSKPLGDIFDRPRLKKESLNFLVGFLSLLSTLGLLDFICQTSSTPEDSLGTIFIALVASVMMAITQFPFSSASPLTRGRKNLCHCPTQDDSTGF